MSTEAANLNPEDQTVTYTVAVKVPAAFLSGGGDPGALFSVVPGAIVAAVAEHAPAGASASVSMGLDGGVGFDVIESPES